jgi:drug/metabolite transporter (DMT)-like permease
MDVSVFLIIRFSLALALVAMFMPELFRGMTSAHWLMGMATGILFSAGMVPQVLGLHAIPASRSGFLTSLSVVFTPLLMITVERRLPRWAVVAGAVVALAGTAVLTGLCEWSGGLSVRLASDASNRFGIWDIMTVLAAFLFAVDIILIDLFSQRMPPGNLTPGMFLATLICASILLLATIPLANRSLEPIAACTRMLADIPFLLLTLSTSVFCTVLAFHLMNKYQAHVSPAHAALIYTLEPIFATLWAMCLPGQISPLVGLDYASERPGWELVMGGLLVVSGNALALAPSRKASKSLENTE